MRKILNNELVKAAFTLSSAINRMPHSDIRTFLVGAMYYKLTVFDNMNNLEIEYDK